MGSEQFLVDLTFHGISESIVSTITVLLVKLLECITAIQTCL